MIFPRTNPDRDRLPVEQPWTCLVAIMLRRLALFFGVASTCFLVLLVSPLWPLGLILPACGIGVAVQAWRWSSGLYERGRSADRRPT